MNSSRKLHYKSDQIEVTYDPKLCIHAAECVKGLPKVFNPNSKPWVDPNNASSDEVAAVIERCPTGALKYKRLDGGKKETNPAETNIKIVSNGPLYLSGKIKITDTNGENFTEETRVALCRCGQSKNKPFCDNTHKEIDFNG